MVSSTHDESWQVVPGGWSIGVEFSFYFMFPVLACYVISLKRSLIFFASSLVVSFLAYFYISNNSLTHDGYFTE